MDIPQLYPFENKDVKQQGKAAVFIRLCAVSVLLLVCTAGALTVQQGIVRLPCIARYAAHPYVQPTLFISLGKPHQDSFYRVALGESRPIATGFTSWTVLELPIPLTKAHTCGS
jgi:hypothetical protein